MPIPIESCNSGKMIERANRGGREIYLRAITRFDLSRGAPHGPYVRKDYREEIVNYAIRT